MGVLAGADGFLCATTHDGLRDVNSLLSVYDAGGVVTIGEDSNNPGQIVGTVAHDGLTRPVFLNRHSLPNSGS